MLRSDIVSWTKRLFADSIKKEIIVKDAWIRPFII